MLSLPQSEGCTFVTVCEGLIKDLVRASVLVTRMKGESRWGDDCRTREPVSSMLHCPQVVTLNFL